MDNANKERAVETDLEGPFKIEELATTAKISIDTIRFYQTRGLLDPPVRTGRQAVYDTSHLERLREIRELQKSGLSLNTIRRMFSKDVQEADKALFDALTRPSREGYPAEYLTIDELSVRTSIPKPLLQSLVNEGLIPPVIIGEAEVFPASDIEMARAGLALLESGIPLSALLELAKKHHNATKRSALLAIDLFDEHIRNPITEENNSPETSEKLIETFNRLLPAAVALVAGHFERTLLALAQRHLENVGSKNEIEAVRKAMASPKPSRRESR